MARLEAALKTAHEQTDKWQAEYTRAADRLREARALEVTVEELEKEKNGLLKVSIMKDKALEGMLEEHSKVLKAQEETYQGVLETALAASKQEKDEQHAADTKRIEALEAEVEAVRSDALAVTRQGKEASRSELDKLVAMHAQEMADAADKHRQEVEKLVAEQALMKANHDSDMAALKAAHTEDFEAAREAVALKDAELEATRAQQKHQDHAHLVEVEELRSKLNSATVIKEEQGKLLESVPLFGAQPSSLMAADEDDDLFGDEEDDSWMTGGQPVRQSTPTTATTTATAISQESPTRPTRQSSWEMDHEKIEAALAASVETSAKLAEVETALTARSEEVTALRRELEAAQQPKASDESGCLAKAEAALATARSELANAQRYQMPGLPVGWIWQHDPGLDKLFYVDTTTGHVQWEPPPVHVEALPQGQPPAPAHLNPLRAEIEEIKSLRQQLQAATEAKAKAEDEETIELVEHELAIESMEADKQLALKLQAQKNGVQMAALERQISRLSEENSEYATAQEGFIASLVEQVGG